MPTAVWYTVIRPDIPCPTYLFYFAGWWDQSKYHWDFRPLRFRFYSHFAHSRRMVTDCSCPSNGGIGKRTAPSRHTPLKKPSPVEENLWSQNKSVQFRLSNEDKSEGHLSYVSLSSVFLPREIEYETARHEWRTPYWRWTTRLTLVWHKISQVRKSQADVNVWVFLWVSSIPIPKVTIFKGLVHPVHETECEKQDESINIAMNSEEPKSLSTPSTIKRSKRKKSCTPKDTHLGEDLVFFLMLT